MQAPEWSKAPAWAQFLAMDASGAWWWFEKEPALSRSLGVFTAGGWRTEAAKFPGWDASLRARPVATVPPNGEPPAGYRMTDRAGGLSYAAYIAAGWEDPTLVLYGHMERIP